MSQKLLPGELVFPDVSRGKVCYVWSDTDVNSKGRSVARYMDKGDRTQLPLFTVVASVTVNNRFANVDDLYVTSYAFVVGDGLFGWMFHSDLVRA